MKRWKKKLGVVGVDSGSLIVMDPSYIESQWNHEGTPVGVLIWGADYEKGRDILKERHPSLKIEPSGHGGGVIPVESAEEADVVLGIVEQVAHMEKLQYLCSHIETDSSRDICFRTRSDENLGGQLNYKLGHEGMGVVFSSGFGDGTYEVIAHYADYGALGVRIERVEIVMITEKEESMMEELTGLSSKAVDDDDDESEDTN
jgi:hypothetical protein